MLDLQTIKTSMPSLYSDLIEATDGDTIEAKEAELATLTPRAAFDIWLNWNGIVNWTDTILKAAKVLAGKGEL